MLKNAVPAAALVIFLVSCSDDRNYYVNHDKWKITGTTDTRPLSSNPRAIKEILYTNLSDTSFDQDLTGLVSRYNIYRFDTKGNFIFQRYFFDSSSIYEISRTYNSEGLQVNIVATGEPAPYPEGSISKLVSHKTEINKFKSDFYENGRIRYTELTTFLDRGNKVVTEKRERNLLQYTLITEYEKDHVLSRTKKEGRRLTESIYYYSSKNFLDSIVTKSGNRTIVRIINRNNEHGDPVYQEIKERKNEIKSWMKYEYDDKGNWIKKIFSGQDWDSLHPSYSLAIREIKY